MSSPGSTRRVVAAIVLLLGAVAAVLAWGQGRHVAPGTWDFVVQSLWVVGAIFAGFAAVVAGAVLIPQRRWLGVLTALLVLAVAALVL